MKHLIPICLMLIGCGPQDAKQTEDNRIVTVSHNNSTDIVKDTKTGCEFIISNAGYASVYTYIPGTCNDDK